MSQSIEPATLRPLPARPNLEFERKRAKRLVRSHGGAIALADAQRMIAREYGFSSWRKLVVYYRGAEALDQAPTQTWSPGGGFDGLVDLILQEFCERRERAEQPPDANGTAAAAASYIPRFYGLSDAEIFAAGITEEEARLIVARRWRFPSWETLTTHRSDVVGARPKDPSEQSAHAWRPSRGESIAEALRTRPDLRRAPTPSTPYEDYEWKVILEAFAADRTMMQQCLADTSIDLQPHLDFALLGRPGWGVSTTLIRGLLDLGANPNWMPSNGATVLEHALALYKNGEAASLIAVRVRPRRSLWVAAGVGDVAGMRQFLDRRGRPTAAAREHRLDMVALGSLQFYTGRPDASDTDLLFEAFLIAGMNGRTEAMQALLDVGLPVDYRYLHFTMLHIAVDQADVAVVEFLLRNGANPDFRVTPMSHSPRDFAELEREGDAAADARERILQLFGSQ